MKSSTISVSQKIFRNPSKSISVLSMSFWSSFFNSSNSSKSSVLSTSHSKICYKTVISSLSTSYSTCKMWIPLGNFSISDLLIAFIRQVLPIPFRPTRPYFLPRTSRSWAPSNKALPPTIKVTEGILMS